MADELGLAGDEAGLRAANARLRGVIERQDAQLRTAAEQIAALTGQVAALSEQIAELKARLAQNPRNSSVPPSSEGLRKKPAQPRQRGARKPGKQPGSEGKHLAQVAEPDEVVTHAPTRCRGCGGGLEQAPVVGQTTRQVFDLPPVRLVCTEHRAQRRRCGCGTVTTAAFPAQASGAACYGPGIRALVAYLSVYQHLPTDRMARLLDDVFGAAVSAGTIAGITAQAGGLVAPAVKAITRLLAQAKVVCFDETGARVAGGLHWLHSASTSQLSLFTVHAKRGKTAMDDAGVLPDLTGVAVHDGWKPYYAYPQLTHGLCNAHHIRELTALVEQGQQWAAHLIETLLQANAFAAEARDAGLDAVPAERLAAIRARYDGLITQGHEANPIVAGQRKQTKAANLVRRLDRCRDDVLRFLSDLAVPFTNNQAEREVRMTKLQQKISGCWRTLPGAQAFAATRSYIATARKHGLDPLEALRRAFADDLWIPTATGPPADLAAAA
ncbi:MAG: IS66 family transposase [Egibacteraceae bacterium]